MELYCLKCREKREISNLQEGITVKGTRILKGKCPKCNTKVCRMLGK